MQRASKYGAIKTEVNGIKFASKSEAERYEYLSLLERAKEISDLQLQPRFTLQDKFVCNGKTERAIVFQADFMFTEKGQTVVEDVKGLPTPVSLMKFKMFRRKFPEYQLRLIKKQGKSWKQIG